MYSSKVLRKGIGDNREMLAWATLYCVDLDVCEYVLAGVSGEEGGGLRIERTKHQMGKESWANGLWWNLPDIKGPGTALW